MTWQAAPVLGVRSVAEAVDYFQNVLGFECPGGMYGEDGEPPVYAVMRRDDCEVHLQIRRRTVFAGERGSFEGDAYLFVENVDALYEELKGNGASVLRPPMDEPYGLRDFTIETPHGHRLAFAERPSAAE